MISYKARKIILPLSALFLGAVTSIAQQPKQPAAPAPTLSLEELTKKEEVLRKDVSYLYGSQIGSSTKRSGFTLDQDQFILGYKDGAESKDLRISQEQAQKIMQEFGQIQQQKQKIIADENLGKGKKFLEENKKKKGIKVTESGLQYEVLKESSEGEFPQDESLVKVHYKGSLTDGTVFDQSGEGEPRKFPVRGVIKGWSEGLKLMKPGAKYRFFISPELAYGPYPRPGIPGNSVLLFDVELVSVEAPAPRPAATTQPISIDGKPVTPEQIKKAQAAKKALENKG